VDRVRQIKRWQEQRLSLDEIRERLVTREANPLAELTERLAGELLQGEPAAVPDLLQADELGVPLPVLFQDVVQRVQYEVGQRWQQGVLRVGQEHEITEMLREAIAQLSWRHAASPEGPPILAACAPGEDHDLGLRMVVGLLRARGRQVHFLGTQVDGRFLLEEIRNRQPAVVLLSATLPARLTALEQLLTDLRADPLTKEIPVIVGGGIVQTMWAEITRFGAIPNRAADLDSAVDRIVQLSQQPSVRRDTLALTVW
jgi:methanogenic corrinoid protein MtbC1